ncbi:hypothetical protein IP70_22515, partial [alpha proteobacterium AAP38]
MSKIGSTIAPRGKRSRRGLQALALEPRMMFDAAMVATATSVGQDTVTQSPTLAEHADPVADLLSSLSNDPVPLATESPRKEVAFIDTSVAGYETLVDGVKPGVEVVLLDGSRDGLAQMSAWAAGKSGYDAIHVLSHGAEGKIQLGSVLIDTAFANQRAADLQVIGGALAAEGDLMLYGCEVAGENGQEFIAQIAELTGADVAASDDKTGNTSKGADWDLEETVGAVASAPLVISQYADTLSSVVGMTVKIVEEETTTTTISNTVEEDSNGGSNVDIIQVSGDQFRIVFQETGASSSQETITIEFKSGAVSISSIALDSANSTKYTDGGSGAKNLASTLTFNSSTNILTFTREAFEGFFGIEGETAYTMTIVPVATTPAITSATYDASTNMLTVTGTNLTNGDAIDETKLTLTGQGGSTYTLTETGAITASSSTSFSITLNATDQLHVEGLLNKNGTSSAGSTTYNLAAAADWHGTGNADLTGNAVTVSNVQTPTITSSTYDASTGVLTVTGTNLVRQSGTTNDIDLTKLTITGQGSGTQALTGAVEIVDATSFTVTLSGGTKTAVDALLNANGTSSVGGTTYNIAAADDWNGPITGGSIADTTGNAITVSGVGPTVSSVTSSTNNGSYKAGGVISIQVNFSETVNVTGTPQLTLETGTTDRVLDYASGTGTSTLTFTYTVQAGDTSSDLDYISTSALALNGGTIKNGGGTDATLTLATPGAANSLGANKAIIIDTTAPSAPSTPNMVAGTDSGASNSDDITNDTTPNLSGTAEGSATITLYDTDGTTVVGTGTAQAGGNWLITTSTLSEGTHTITAKATDAAGNVSVASSGLTITIDTTAPALTIPNGTAFAYTENGTAAAIAGSATLTEIGSPGSASLAVQITANNEAADRLSLPTGTSSGINVNGTDLRSGTTNIGTVTASNVTNGTSWTINFLSTATAQNIQDTIAAIQYDNTSDNPGTSNRTVSFTLTDGAGNAATAATRTVAVTAVNDAPTAISPSTGTVSTFDSANATAATLGATDADHTAWTFTIQSISHTTLGTGLANDGSIFNLASAGAVASNALRATTPSGLTAGTYTVTVRADDGAGGTFDQAVTVTVSDTLVVTVAAIDSNAPTGNYSSDLADGGGLDLREALALAASGGKTIGFASGLNGATITLGGTYNVAANTTFDADTVGTLTIAASSLNLAGALTVTNASGDTLTISSNLTGSDPSELVKTGAGTLVLGGTNNGGSGLNKITASAGTLRISGDANLGTGVVKLQDGVTFDTGTSILSTDNTFNSTNSDANAQGGGAIFTQTGSGHLTITGALEGDRLFTKSGDGKMTLSGDYESFIGNVLITNGTLYTTTALDRLGDGTVTLSGGTLDISSASTFTNNITFTGDATISNGSALTLSGSLSGTGKFTKSGDGDLTLSGTNTHTGNIDITAGKLIASGGSAIGNSSAVTLSGSGALQISASETIGALTGNSSAGTDVTIDNGMTLTAAYSSDATMAGVIGGAGAFTKTGAGNLTLSGANTYTGATTISAGTVTLNVGTLADASNVTVASGATLALSTADTLGSIAGAGTISLGAALTAGGSGSSTEFSGVFTGSGAFTKTGTGTLSLSGNSNSYSGAITVSAGTLLVTHNNALGGTGGNTTVSTGATLSIGEGLTIAETLSLAGSGAGSAGALRGYANTGAASASSTVTGAISLINPNVTIAVDTNRTLTLSGIISGSGGLIKSGAGTLILSADNTYTGVNSVSAGTLLIDGQVDNNVTVASGATLGGKGTVWNGNVTVDAGGTLAPGSVSTDNDGIGSFTLNNGNLTLNGTAAFQLKDKSTAGTDFDQIDVSGTVTIGSSAALTVTALNSYSLGTNTITLIKNDGSDAVSSSSSSVQTDKTVSGTYLLNLAGDSGNDITVLGNRPPDMDLNGSDTGTSNTVSLTNAANGLATSGATVDDPDDTWDGGSLTVRRVTGTGTADGNANDVFSLLTGSGLSFTGSITKGSNSNGTVSDGATQFATWTYTSATGSLSFTFDADGTDTRVQTLVRSIGYSNDKPYGDTIIRLTVTDGGGSATSRDVTVTSSTIYVDSTSDDADGDAADGFSLREALARGVTQTGADTIKVVLSDNASITLGSGVTAGASDTLDLDSANELTITGSTVTLAGALTVSNGSSDTATISSAIAGSGTFTKTGAGTLTLSSTNSSLTGAVSVTGGTLAVGASAISNSADLTLDGGTLASTTDVSYSKAIALGSNGGTLNLSSGSMTLSGVVSGTGKLTITSTNAGNAATVSGSNTHSGGTTLDSGILQFNNNSAAGTGTLTINGGKVRSNAAVTISNAVVLGGTLTMSGSNAMTFSGAVDLGGADRTINNSITSNLTLSGTISNGSLTVANQGTGALILSGTNSYTTTSVTAGTLSITGDSNLGSGAVTLNGSAAVLAVTGSAVTIDNAIAIGSSGGAVSNANAVTLSGVLSGTGSLAKQGAGTLTLSGTNTHTGAVTVSAGTLALSGGSSIGDNSAVTVDSGATLSLTGGGESIGSLAGAGAVSLSYNLTVGNASNTTFSGIISSTNTSGITKVGTGTLTLTGANTYTGATNVSAGGLTLNASGGTLSDSTAVTVASGATLTVSSNDTVGSLSGAGTVALGSSLLTFGGNNTSTSFDGTITGSNGGSIKKQGTGTFSLSGTNSFVGGTDLAAGTIVASAVGALGTGGVSFAAGTTLDLAATGTFTNYIDLAAAGTINVGTGIAATLSNSIEGAGSLTKTGAGTLILTGTSTYTGLTSVNAGTLLIDGQIEEDVTVASGATLGGKGTIWVGDVTVDKGGTLAPGSTSTDNDGIGTFTLNNGNLTLNGTAAFQLKGKDKAGTDFDQIDVAGSVTVGADAAITVTALNSYSLGNNTITLINNDSNDTVTNSSTTLVTNATVSGNYLLNMAGDSGNDITVLGNRPPDMDLNGSDTGTGNTVSLTNAANGLTTSGATVNDPEDTWDGGSLTVRRVTGTGTADGNANDVFSLLTGSGLSFTGSITKGSNSNGTVSDGATQFATWTYTSATGSLSFTFDADGTDARVQTLVRSIGYSNDKPYGDTTIRLTVTDGGGGATSRDVTVTSNTIYVDSTSDDADGDAFDGFSLREALARGVVQTGADTIKVVLGDKSTITLGSGVTAGASDTLDLDSANELTITGSTLTIGTGNSLTITNGSSDIATISSVIAGAGDLTKTGAGTLVLSGTQTGTGTMTVQGGTVSVATDANLLGGSITLNSGALSVTTNTTIDNALSIGSNGGTLGNNGNSYTLSGQITSAAGTTLTIANTADANTVAFTNSSNSSTFAGNILVSKGTLQIGSNAIAAGQANTGSITLASGSTLQLPTLGTAGTITLGNSVVLNGNASIATNNNQLTLSGAITGNGGLTKTGSGTLVLSAGSGSNTYSGGTTVSDGKLSISNASHLGSGTLTLNGGTLRMTAGMTGTNAIVLASNSTIEVGTSTYTTWSGVISGSGSLVKTGAGSLSFNAANTYTGNTTISEGAIVINSATATLGGPDSGNGNAYGTLTINDGAHLDFNYAVTIANNLVMGGVGVGYGAIQAGFASGPITFSGAVTLTSNTLVDPGNNTLEFSGGISAGGNSYALTNAWNGTIKLSGTASNWTGGLTTAANHTGIFSISDSSNIGSGQISLNGGSLTVTGSNVTLSNNIALGSGGGTVDSNNALTLSGVIAGSAALTKTGSGTLTLSGTNTYSDATNVSAGTLVVTGSLGGTSSLTVASGATLGGTGSIFAASSTNSLTVNSGGTIAPGAAGTNDSVGKLTINGNLTLNGTAAFQLKGKDTAGTDFDQVDVLGTITVGSSAALSITTLNSYSLGNNTITLIKNDGSDAVSNSSTTLVTNGIVANTYLLSLVGDSGNDITVLGNRPPVLTKNGATLDEGDVVTLGSATLSATDPETSTATQLVYKVTTAPLNGTLFKDMDGDGVVDDGEALALNATFTQQDINDNKIKFRHDGSETTEDSITFSVTDKDNVSLTGQTLGMTINRVNDAPVLGNFGNSIKYTENEPGIAINATATVSDAEIGNSGYFNNGSLTIVRQGGANFDDVFGVSGTVSALTTGGNIVVNGNTIGTVTKNSNGELSLSFSGNGDATKDRVQELLRSITYSSKSDNPSVTVTLVTTINDGNSGSQGSGGAKTATGTTTVAITPINDAPTSMALSNTQIGQKAAIAGGTVGTFTLEDPDGSGIETYSISSGNGAGFFAISGRTLVTQGKVLAGTYNLEITANDGGNPAKTLPASFTVTVIDDLAPTGYKVVLSDDLVNAAERGALTINLSDAEIGTTYNYTLTSSGGGSVTGTGSVTSQTQSIGVGDISSLKDGTLSVSVTLTDKASNVGTAAAATSILDATAPAGTISIADSLLNATEAKSVTLSSTGTKGGDTYSYTVTSSGGGSVSGSGTWAADDGTITLADVSWLGDGTLTVSLEQADKAGNKSTG